MSILGIDPGMQVHCASYPKLTASHGRCQPTKSSKIKAAPEDRQAGFAKNYQGGCA